MENNIQTIVTRFRFNDTLQEIADATGVTVEQVIAVLRDNSKQWDLVND